nr:GEVED domain-containing protein [Thiolinea sp.]
MKNAAFSGLVSRWLGYGLLLSMPLLAWGADDFGDAPETYGDASHVIVSGLYLGNNPPDAEAASQYSINAFGDADPRSAMLDGVSVSWRDSGDEDGAPRQPVGDYIPLFPVLKMTAMQYRVDLTVTNATASAATLFGWIDFDGNGQFDPDEAASAAVPDGTGTGTVTLDWEVPVDIRLGTTFARFRLTSDPAVTTATPAGAASSGEVEDYPLAVAMDIPPESTSVSIVSGVTPLACQKPVFSDDFDDLASSLGQFIAPRRVGPTISVRD